MDALLDDLAEALEGVDPLVAGLGAGDRSRPTPCAGWTVDDLVAHLLAGHAHAAAVVREAPPPAPPDPDTDPRATYRAAAYDVLGAFGEPCVLTRTYTLPVGTVPGAVAVQLRTVEALVHGWDLATAVGGILVVRDAVAGRALGFSTGMLAGLPPDRSPFAPPVAVRDDAPPLARLVALLGRDPGEATP